jgi:hypothetical protein
MEQGTTCEGIKEDQSDHIGSDQIKDARMSQSIHTLQQGKPYLFVSDSDFLHILWEQKQYLVWVCYSMGPRITKSGETSQTPFKLSQGCQTLSIPLRGLFETLKVLQGIPSLGGFERHWGFRKAVLALVFSCIQFPSAGLTTSLTIDNK